MKNINNIELVIPDCPFFIFNTETRRKEIFSSSTRVLMYTCGPTVYNYAHIGNFRTYVFEDILKRSLEFFGKDVIQVMNITDVEDKTIAGSIKAQLSLNEFTAPYIDAFFEDLNSLKISPATFYPRATQFIPDMIEAIQKLIDTGYAYISHDRSVYFSIAKSSHYGKLSHLKEKQLQQTTRIQQHDEYEKEAIGDFALWKAYDEKRDGKVFWESPFGKGRPGWHLECSIMATKLLGMNIDIHSGGVDNIFPHHENEIAQSEALFQGNFVRYWVHSEHLLVNGKKMSKKLGNFFTLKDLLLKGYSGEEIRYMLLQSHYRSPLNFTEEALLSCRSTIKRVNEFISKLTNLKNTNSSSISENVQKLVNECMSQFSLAISNDLNIQEGLASLFNLIHPINSLLDQNKISNNDASFILLGIKKINSVLNVFNLEQNIELPDHLKQLLEVREQARLNKDWSLADNIRQQLLEHNYIIEDTSQGPRLKKKN